MRDSMKRGITHQVGPEGKYQDAREYAIEKVKWILANHHPEPLDPAKQIELTKILAAADHELN
jgi:trimethylamine:corrinoid methyltransferase-like protein